VVQGASEPSSLSISQDDRASVKSPPTQSMSSAGGGDKMGAQALLKMLRSGAPVASPLEKQQLLQTQEPQQTQSQQTADRSLISNPSIPQTPLSIPQTPDSKVKGTGLLFRIARNQPGLLSIFLMDRDRHSGFRENLPCADAISVSPGFHMNVKWQLPLKELMANPDGNFCIGLVRYGSPTNNPCIIAKRIDLSGRATMRTVSKDGIEMLGGSIQFHAPKSAGVFVYRFFDQSTKERTMITLATSTSFAVDLTDVDVTSNLKNCVECFQDRAHQKGLNQFSSTIKGMRNSGKSIQGASAQFYLCKCVQAVLEIIRMSTIQLDEAAKERNHSQQGVTPQSDVTSAIDRLAVPMESAIDSASISKKEKDESISTRQNFRLQSDAHDALCTLSSNSVAWLILPDDLKFSIAAIEELYCSIFNRYFSSFASRDAARVSDLGFVPEVPKNATFNESVLLKLDSSISSLMPTLLPQPDFHTKRESARLRIENALRGSGVVPSTTQIVLYGSSSNNFGSDGADLDMCMIFPIDFDVPQEKRPEIIEKIAESLSASGMLEVSARSTARIPIVQFTDPLTGLECDISFNNPLAICNTRLLKAYSEVDPRVVPLVFIIKRWAKARCMNNPGEGTLSSYGYILCLIHYLQSRTTPPLLPFLQSLHPSWDSSTSSSSSQSDSVSASKNTTHHQNHDMCEHSVHPVEGVSCNTYFYVPTQSRRELLRRFSERNKDSTAKLLAGFFRYFAWEFDYRLHVVSVRNSLSTPGSSNFSSISGFLKITKAEQSCWSQHDRLSVEDPFETWYDVAHVIKRQQMNWLRKEFLRAYTLISRTSVQTRTNGGAASDCLPDSLNPDALLNLLLEESAPPPFSKRERSDTVHSDLED